MSAPAPGSNLNRISIVLGFLGLFITGYLTWTHYQRVLPPCTAGSNCDVVLTHPTAKLFGIPVALLGFIGYVAVTTLAVLRSRLGEDAWRKSALLGMGVTGFGAAVSSVYTYIALALIQAQCQWCLASFATMLCLFFLHVSMAFGKERPKASGIFDLPATAVGAVLASVLFFFSVGRVNAEGLEGLPDVNVGNKTRAEILPSDPNRIVGPDTARVVLVEFADPNCPACRRAHPEVKALLKRFEGKIQYAFRTLPLYQIPGHETSINLGLALEYAAEKGRHKEMMDVIFDPQNTDMIRTDAGVLQAVKNAGLDSDEFNRILEEADEESAAKRQELFDKLGVDFSTAQAWGIRSTPTFILYTEGSRPKAMFFGSVLRSLSIEPLASLLEK